MITNYIKIINNFLFDLKKLTILSIFFGIFFRFSHLIFYGFRTPFRLGGLFLAFSKEIYLNNFTLPISIPYYTKGGISFVYPPLPFYLESFMVFCLKIPNFFIVNFLPVFFSILSLLLFVYLIQKVKISDTAKSFSIIFFSFCPQTFTEQIMGAGLSESIGTLSLIIFGFYLYNFLKHYHQKSSVLLSISLAFCIYSSPGSAFAAVIVLLVSILYLFSKSVVFKEKNLLYLIINTLIILIISLIITLPYWHNITSNHGLKIIIDSVFHQINSTNDSPLYFINFFIRSLFQFNFIYIGYTGIWNALIVVCIFYLFLNKNFLVPIIFIIVQLIPRESVWIAPIIGSIIFGLFFSFQTKFEYNRLIYPIFFSVLFLTSFFYMVDFITLNQKSNENLTLEEINLIEEMKEKIPIDGNVIIIGNDGFIEWFPFLSERTVMNVEYGTEFDPTKQEQITFYNNSIKSCLDLKCIIDLTEDTFGYDTYYFVIDKQKINNGIISQELYNIPRIFVFN